MINKKSVDAIRFLGVDAINNANSGHPGIVLGAAPIVYSIFNHLEINVKNTKWANRDRFVLSAGHGSGMLYAVNHLVGYDITVEDLKNFRKVGNTPGHPEYGYTEGVESTTGPLGQGIATAVGMAIAEAHLGARFNREGFNLIDNYTYVVVGDGDLQEGIALEAMSLAGRLGLGKLIVLFDSNDIQLDGPVGLTVKEDVKSKFESQNWHYLKVEDGENLDSLNEAINDAKKVTDKPTLVEVKTVIGLGASKQGTSGVHGAPLGDDVAKAREFFGWDLEPFVVSEDIYENYKEKVTDRGLIAYNNWNALLERYSKAYPEEYQLFNEFLNNDYEVDLDIFNEIDLSKTDATRNVNGKAIDLISKNYLNFIGGSADLTSSTKAKGADGDFDLDHHIGRNINFGVREHAMGAIVNGLTLSGLRAFSGAFFVFSDYMKPAMRLASLMQIPSTFVFTHDTIAVGEDGPTHQPIEQLAGLRAIPNMNVIRPADANETVAAWKVAYDSVETPTTLVFTRQNVPTLPNTSYEGLIKGAYVVASEEEKLDGILLAAGSEVSLAVEAKAELLKDGIDVRVVSMPSMHLFDLQEESYKEEILPNNVKTLAIEMGSSMPWYKYARNVYGIDKFGVSTNGNEAIKLYGFTKENIAEEFKNIK